MGSRPRPVRLRGAAVVRVEHCYRLVRGKRFETPLLRAHTYLQYFTEDFRSSLYALPGDGATTKELQKHLGRDMLDAMRIAYGIDPPPRDLFMDVVA